MNRIHMCILGSIAVASVAVGGAWGQPHELDDVQMMVRGHGPRLGVSVSEPQGGEGSGQARGALIGDVTEGGPAARAGVKPRDLVVEFDGERVRSARQFSRLIEETPTGVPVRMSVLRDGRRADLTVTLDRPSPVPHARILRPDRLPRGPRMFDLPGREGGMFHFPGLDGRPGARTGRLGVSVMELSSQLAGYFGVERGVLVTSVDTDSSAAKAGVVAGDVITAVDGHSVADPDDLRERLFDAKEDSEVTLSLMRNRKAESVKARLVASAERGRTRVRI